MAGMGVWAGFVIPMNMNMHMVEKIILAESKLRCVVLESSHSRCGVLVAESGTLCFGFVCWVALEQVVFAVCDALRGWLCRVCVCGFPCFGGV
jgi:hypothetical protein